MNRFPRVLGVRVGYDPDQVDALIRRIEGTLGRGSLEGEPITADEIREARFRTKLGGYNETAVDFALEAFIVAVETRSTGWRRPVIPRPQPTATEDAPGAPAHELDDPPHVSFGEPESLPGEPESFPGEPERPSQASSDGTERRHEPSGESDDPPRSFFDESEEHAAESEEHAARIERVAFRAGRLGMGYNEDEVDTFLDRVVATLRGTTDQPVTPSDVREARFATVILKPGYAVNEVDEFLSGLADVLEAHFSR
ncbi:DivIVA domain-containing protein [Streptosporangium sp. NPDC000396]|uniref:DivIVA domain-containing protein n=1 Tax=Streptosporangium sp. NPDC000396 TaxID=3366185 RepID=UPI00369AEC32